MNILRSAARWRNVRRTLRGSIGFVPTMGALHPGHLSLLERSMNECDITVLSIYLNPTQFDNPADLECYPETLERDLELARALGVDWLIIPDYDEIYRDGYRFQVREREFSKELCGAHRDGHFTGVLTVVLKLLNLVRPERAYFGEKDYQQYLLIRDMCDAFFLDVDIVPCTTVRECDGLAMSSRNAYLDERGRDRAPRLHALLTSQLNDEHVAVELARAGFKVDYVITRAARRFAAASLHCGHREIRLIDNVSLTPKAISEQPMAKQETP
ncbi:MAG: pantoate--beta-alanine ligase [Gammaproteobacteria bacterium]|nr:pantoate--beta-alanine ligase [Gammaproteobacteria bacterium]